MKNINASFPNLRRSIRPGLRGRVLPTANGVMTVFFLLLLNYYLPQLPAVQLPAIQFPPTTTSTTSSFHVKPYKCKLGNSCDRIDLRTPLETRRRDFGIEFETTTVLNINSRYSKERAQKLSNTTTVCCCCNNCYYTAFGCNGCESATTSLLVQSCVSRFICLLGREHPDQESVRHYYYLFIAPP